MVLPDIELQTALYRRLSADEGLLSLVSGVYDHVTEDTAFPYVVLSNPTISDESLKNSEVFEYSVTLHIWHNQATSGEYGNRKPFLIKQAVYDALRYKLELPSYHVRRVCITENLLFNDVDDRLKHGVLTYRFTLQTKTGV